ncbi:MAG: carbohydrate ABC transporter permease [Cyanobacteria bacterium SID2]|nr:carbohydrate ABC transporter permease [Cyanobacteria bacterium SID2]MBP0003035.1 carbohydrate ABC transporter permease [Cyanobacteria bacterium SBC]
MSDRSPKIPANPSIEAKARSRQKSAIDFSNQSRLLNLLFLMVGAGIVLFPLLVVLRASFAPSGSVLSLDLTGSWTLENYQQVWQRGRFWRAFANSTFVALSVTGFQVLTSALAGYALARLKFWGRRSLLTAILATLAIPFQLLVVPVFLILKWGHLLDTYGALILPTAVNGFGIFLMRQYFVTIPVALEEAAALDGANRWQILTQVMLPLSRPALVTLSLLAFIGEWNDLFKPLVFTTQPALQTVQLALAEFQEQFTNDWPLLMAAVAITTLPILVLFFLGQRQFVRGIAATGVKS